MCIKVDTLCPLQSGYDAFQLTDKASARLTSFFLGEVFSAVGVNVMSELDEVTGSFLGEIFTFLGEGDVLLFGPSPLSSSFFFIVASLELALTGAGFFLGDGLITSSDVLRLILDGLPVLPAAESVWLFLGNVVGSFSSEPLRA